MGIWKCLKKMYVRTLSSLFMHLGSFSSLLRSMLYKMWQRRRGALKFKGETFHMKAGKVTQPSGWAVVQESYSCASFWKFKTFLSSCDIQGWRLLLLQWLSSVLHQQADGCWSCIELGHFILLNDLPEAADMRVDWNTFKLKKKKHTRVYLCRRIFYWKYIVVVLN